MKQKSFRFYKDMEPLFQIGQRVWYLIESNESDQYFLEKNPDWSRVRTAVVRGYNLKMYPNYGKLTMVCVGYDLDVFCFNNLGYFTGLDLYATEQEAIADAQWIKCEGITAEEWMQALGSREANDDPGMITIEKSELGTCCAAISETRDLLYRCRDNGGLIYRDVNHIVLLLESSHETLSTKQTILMKIFRQLKIYKEDDNERSSGPTS